MKSTEFRSEQKFLLSGMTKESPPPDLKTKVGLLELGKQLGNVTKACRVIGYSPDSFIDSENFTTEVERQAL